VPSFRESALKPEAVLFELQYLRSVIVSNSVSHLNQIVEIGFPYRAGYWVLGLYGWPEYQSNPAEILRQGAASSIAVVQCPASRVKLGCHPHDEQHVCLSFLPWQGRSIPEFPYQLDPAPSRAVPFC
jgi:hypothetical protein